MFFIRGDFNVIVGELKDFIPGDINRLDALPDDCISDTDLRRVTQDKTVNAKRV